MPEISAVPHPPTARARTKENEVLRQRRMPPRYPAPDVSPRSPRSVGSAGGRREVVPRDDVREPVGPGERHLVAGGELGHLGEVGTASLVHFCQLAEQALEAG